MPTTVRRIRPDEALPFREVRLRALADSPSAFGSTHAEESGQPLASWMERVQRGAESCDNAMFVAESARAANWVGIAGAFRDDPAAKAVRLVSVWVAPEGRRAGTGKCLVQAVVDWCASVDATEVQLWVTRGNDPAFELYRSLGFELDGAYQPVPSDPCRDEIPMRLVLGS